MFVFGGVIFACVAVLCAVVYFLLRGHGDFEPMTEEELEAEEEQ